MTGFAVITCHLAHKVAPVFGEGVISVSTFLDWENACDNFFEAAKEPITEDKKVSKVTDGLHHSQINSFVWINKGHLHGLMFMEFITELHEVFLPADCDQDILQKILNSRMSSDSSFFDWSMSIISSNNLLVGQPMMLSEARICEQLFHNMMEDPRCYNFSHVLFSHFFPLIPTLPFSFSSIASLWLISFHMIQSFDSPLFITLCLMLHISRYINSVEYLVFPQLELGFFFALKPCLMN